MLWVLGLVLSAQALAQSPKTGGFSIGEGRLHPFLEIDGRFDSLVGYFTRDGAGNIIASPELILHARPGLKFELENASTLVAFNGAAEYLWYTGLLSPSSSLLSRFQANVGLDTKFNRDGAAEVQLGDNLVRSDRSQSPTLAVGVNSLFNNAYLAIPIHPGGRALEITPKVAWAVEFFDPLLPGFLPGCTVGQTVCDPNLVAQANYSNLNFGLNGRWKFLPKTAAVVDVNADLRSYFNGTANPPSTIFRAQAGLSGLISSHFGATLLAGYGGELSTGAINTVIGTAEITYNATVQSRVSLGYTRNAAPVPLLGTMVDDRGYARGAIGLLGDRLVFEGQVSADFLTFLGRPTTPGVPNLVRNDFVLNLSAGPTVSVTSWFDVKAAYLLSVRSSSSTLPSLNFPRHEAFLTLSFHY